METNKDSIVDVRSVVEAISSDDNDAPLYQVESLCMRCRQNGTTRFLITLIPHFRKILLSAFECPHCGERNNEVQFAGELQPRGCHYQLNFPPGDQKMLNRQVVKSDTATIKIPELDFEIPPEAQRGSLSTVEGILLRAADEIEALQEERKKVDPQSAEAIDWFLPKLRACAKGESSFTIILDDPAGNSFIENPFAPSPDPSSTIKFYERTPEQQASLGYVVDPSLGGEHRDEALSEELNSTGDQTRREPHGLIGAVAGQRAIAQGNSAEFAESLFRYSAPEEVMTFPSTCGTCAAKCETRMFVTNIPYFREVIVMASSCDACGYRNSELKPGGRIPEKGKKITVLVKNINDLSRDVIKSDTASVEVPELDLVLTSGTLGGVVTTVEGLITKISENLERVHGFTFGDSLDDSKKSKWLDFRARLNKLLIVEDPWTLIIDDALANSFVAPATDDVKDDHQLSFEEYERSWEQNEELGLNDIDTSSADAAYESTDATRKEGTTHAANGVVENILPMANNAIELKDWRRHLQHSLDKLRDHFCRQYVLNFIYSRDGEAHLDAQIYLHGERDDLIWDSNLPSLPFQALFGKLQQLATVAGDVLLGKERIQKILLARLTETMVMWLSDEQEFWGVLEDDSAHLQPLGLQQLILDMHFTVEIARFAGYPSQHIHQIASSIITRAIRTFSARGINPQSALPADKWFAETAKTAIHKLLQGASGSDTSDIDEDHIAMDDEHIMMNDEQFSDTDEAPSSLSTVDSFESFASAQMGELESPVYLSDPED